MMTITPNFNFDGKCGEAITLYQENIYQGDFTIKMKSPDNFKT